MVDTVTGWSGRTKYKDEQAMKIANLVETMWLTSYPWPEGITFDKGS